MRFANVSKLEAAESERRQAAAVSAIADAREAFLDWANDALAEGAARAGELEGIGFESAKDDVHSLFHDLKGAGAALASICCPGSDPLVLTLSGRLKPQLLALPALLPHILQRPKVRWLQALKVMAARLATH